MSGVHPCHTGRKKKNSGFAIYIVTFYQPFCYLNVQFVVMLRLVIFLTVLRILQLYLVYYLLLTSSSRSKFTTTTTLYIIMVTPKTPTGYYKDPCRTRQNLNVKIAMLHASNIKINLAKRFSVEFCV